MFPLNSVINNLLPRSWSNGLSSNNLVTTRKVQLVALLSIPTIGLTTYCFGRVGLMASFGSSVVTLAIVSFYSKKKAPEILDNTNEKSFSTHYDVEKNPEIVSLLKAISFVKEDEKEAISEALARTIGPKICVCKNPKIGPLNASSLGIVTKQYKKLLGPKINTYFSTPEKFIQDGLKTWIGPKETDCQLFFNVQKVENNLVYSVRVLLESLEILNFVGSIEKFIDAARAKKSLV